VFSFYVVFQSLSQFPAGKWRDSRGPGALTFLAALLAGGGYVGLAYATTLWQLYLLYSLGAIGVGIVYTVAVNTAVKWFPDRTGLTTGVGTMAFAGGSALVVPYVRANATAAAYGDVLRNVGVAILVVTLVGAYLLRDPPDDWLGLEEGDGAEGGDRSDNLAASLRGRAYTTREMLSTWQFWLLYAMFVAMAGADLIVIANVVRFAEQFGLAAVVATASATLLPVAAGVSRMILGEASDRFDRKKVMAASFVLAGVFRLALIGRGERRPGSRVRRAGDGGDVLLLAAVRLLPVGDRRRLLRLAKLLRQLRGPLHREGRRAGLRRHRDRLPRRDGRLDPDVRARGRAGDRRGWRRAALLRPPSGSGLEADATAAAD